MTSRGLAIPPDQKASQIRSILLFEVTSDHVRFASFRGADVAAVLGVGQGRRCVTSQGRWPKWPHPRGGHLPGHPCKVLRVAAWPALQRWFVVSAVVKFFPGDAASNILDLGCGEPAVTVLVYGLPKQTPDQRGSGDVLGGGSPAQLRV